MSDVEWALRAQKLFWKFNGIMLIIGMCLYVLVIVGVVVLKARF